MKKLDVITRHPKNPIVTRDDFPVLLEGAYNSGCIKLLDGSYAMAARVNYYNQKTTIWWLDSKDGVTFTPRPEPMDLPKDEKWRYYAESVVYDPRITRIEDTGEILLTLACHSSRGCRIATFRSTDETKTWEFIDFSLKKLMVCMRCWTAQILVQMAVAMAVFGSNTAQT